MKKTATPQAARRRRHLRVRRRVNGTGQKPRLCVFRSLTHIYAQVIDDTTGSTIVAASDMEPAIKSKASGKKKAEVATLVGNAVAERAIEKGVEKVVFDRGGYRFHGRIKALADAARAGGLQF